MTDVAGNTGLKREAFSFSGKAGEYFGIWIVNLLLTMVTLGIYSAWAKVRRMRYFYANTWLDGHNFEYHATGKQIFIGRIIVFGFLIIYNIIATIAPLLALIPFVILLIALPWLINKAISFTSRVSTYRNVQFGFEGSYGKAFMIYVLLPIIIPILLGVVIFAHYTSADAGNLQLYFLGYSRFLMVLVAVAGIAQMLLYPYLSKMAAEYIGNRLSYGNAPFSTLADTNDVYKNFGVSVLVSLIPIGMFAIIGVSMASNPDNPMFMILLFVAYLLMIIPFLVYRAGMRNIAYNGTSLDGKHKMVSNLSRRKYTFIQVTNFMAIMCTVGLMRPWAAIRLQNYMVGQTAIDLEGSLDGIVSENEPQGNVAAAEYFDFDGIDFGF